jgi:hypothetical protein
MFVGPVCEGFLPAATSQSLEFLDAIFFCLSGFEFEKALRIKQLFTQDFLA